MLLRRRGWAILLEPPQESTPKVSQIRVGHRVPKFQGGAAELQNLVLVCARCNNQLQTSRTLSQLLLELEHKLAVIRSRLNEEEREYRLSITETAQAVLLAGQPDHNSCGHSGSNL
jgi:hypothetical protein